MSDELKRKTVIITGGNGGLGYQCAEAIAEASDWHVIIACRESDKTRQAVNSLIAETSNRQVEAMGLDLASPTSVRQFATEFSQRGLPPLRAIVCNAARQIISGRTWSKDGFETTFAVNHLGHFLLVNLLLGRLVTPARIVFVSSGTHDPEQWTGTPHPRYLGARGLANPENQPRAQDDNDRTAGLRAYTTSKLCNVMCAYELARRLEVEADGGDKGTIAVTAFDPGLMPGTGLARDYGSVVRFAWSFLLPALRLFAPNVNSTRKSGRALARLVLYPGLEGGTGKYFQGVREIPSSRDSYDVEKAAELCETSAELVKLASNERVLSRSSAALPLASA